MRVIGVIAAIIFVVFTIFSACYPNSTQKDYDTLEEEMIDYEYEIYDLNDKVKDLEQEIEWLREDLKNTEAWLEKYENFVVLMIDDSEYYHKCIDYCEVVETCEIDREDPYTYDIVYLQVADGEGLSPCPDCYDLYID